jgi:CRP/FNR family transcriptional regulator, cyclic AMP receptor protein
MFNKIFDQLTIFEGMDTSQRTLLQAYFVICDCTCDDVIFEQDAPADFLYIVIEGEVAVRFKPDDGPELIVSRIKDGGVFGWSAAFGSGIYTSGAVCTQPSQLLSVRGSDLKMLRENHPETGILILKRLAAIVAERMKNEGDHLQVVALLEHGLRNGVKPIGG